MSYHSDKYIYNDYAESLNRINEAYSNIPALLIEAVHTNQQIFESLPYAFIETNALIQQFYNTYGGILTPYIEQIQPALVAYKSLPHNFIETMDSAASITDSLLNAIRSIDFDSLFTSVQDESQGTCPDDYITADLPVIREISFPDNIMIPLGCNRFKIRTDYFLMFLSIIVSIFIAHFQSIGNETSSDGTCLGQNQSAQEHSQIAQERNQLLREQNQILLKILESIESSESSQAEFFEDMKSSLQEQAALFQAHPESSETNQPAPDTVQEADGPTQEAAGSTQKADDSTPPTADIFLSAPSTGYDNE